MLQEDFIRSFKNCKGNLIKQLKSNYLKKKKTMRMIFFFLNYILVFQNKSCYHVNTRQTGKYGSKSPMKSIAQK